MTAENFCYYPPPPTECGRLMAIPKNFCYYPPPPLNVAGLWRSRKIYATPPPHRIWSACGDHGKVAPPPNKNPGYAVGDGTHISLGAHTVFNRKRPGCVHTPGNRLVRHQCIKHNRFHETFMCQNHLHDFNLTMSRAYNRPNHLSFCFSICLVR